MAQAPVMPLFTDALIGDTMHLSVAEFGAYMLILIATWRNNGQPLPDDDVRLARTCRTRQDTWSRYYRTALVGFFDISDGFWRQKRLEKEWRKLSTKLVVESPLGSNPLKSAVVVPPLGSKSLKSAVSDSPLGSNPLKSANMPKNEWSRVSTGFVAERQNGDTFNGLPLGSNPLKSAETPPLSRARDHIHIHIENPSSSVVPVAARAHELREAAPHAHDNETTWKSLGNVLGQSNAAPPPPDEDRRRHEQMPRHLEFLHSQGTPAEVNLYITVQMSDDPEAAQRMFELTESRIEAK